MLFSRSLHKVSQKWRSRNQESIEPEVFEFEGYRIPVELIKLTGAGPETFEIIAKSHIESYRKFIELRPDLNILEVGSGIGRDAIPFSRILSPPGSYLGIDIIKPSIDWCTENITPRNPHVKFLHFDIRDQLHNPSGSLKTKDIRIPVQDRSVDFICLQSVFTHMFEPDIVHYLSEFRRILRSDGLVFATMFVVTPEVIESSRTKNLTAYDLRFEYQITEDTYINDPVYPLGAIAFTADRIEKMAEKSGMRISGPILPGSWSGLHEVTHGGQDTVILKVA
jgi:SAM-dependent methyltransferase